MARVALALAIVVAAAAVAWWLHRRRPAAPTRDASPVPHQLDRAEFPRPDAPWLVALFSADRCDSCRGLPEKLAAVEGADVAIAIVRDETDRDLHVRYGITGIPTVVIADRDGVVARWFVGPLSAADLWAALAAVRPDP